MLGCRFADGNECSVRSPFDPADAPHGMTLERAVDVGVAPLVVLVEDRRLDSLQIDFEHEIGSGIVAIVAVPDLDHELVALGAVDESFIGESIWQVPGSTFLSQPDLLWNEMKRHRGPHFTAADDSSVKIVTSP